MIGDYFEIYNDMICSRFCKFRGEACEEPGECALNDAAEELKKQYARMILESDGLKEKGVCQ